MNATVKLSDIVDGMEMQHQEMHQLTIPHNLQIFIIFFVISEISGESFKLAIVAFS